MSIWFSKGVFKFPAYSLANKLALKKALAFFRIIISREIPRDLYCISCKTISKQN
jgi:hypothetical protein